MFNIGPTELIVVLVIALIIFGPKRLPEIGRTVGKSLREFKRASDDLRDEFNVNLDAEETPRSTPAPVPPQPASSWSTTELDAPPTPGANGSSRSGLAEAAPEAPTTDDPTDGGAPGGSRDA